jgi:hypothetical protein
MLVGGGYLLGTLEQLQFKLSRRAFKFNKYISLLNRGSR